MHRFLLAALLICALACGCTDGKKTATIAPTATATKGGTLRLPLEVELGGEFKDAQAILERTDDSRLYALARVLEEPLVRAGSDGKPKPGLAASWETADNGRTWQFTLAAGLPEGTFAELGRQWKVLLRGNMRPARAQLADLLAGAGDFAAGKGDELAGFKLDAADPTKLTLELTRPHIAFPLLLSQPRLGLSTVPGETVTTVAPFTFDSANGNTLTLTPNASYAHGAPLVDTLEFICEPDRTQQLELFRAGTLHAANAPLDEAASLPADPELGPRVQHSEAAAVLVGIFDHHQFPWGNAPFQDKTGLRSAMNWALDRSLLEEEVFKGEYVGWGHFFPEPWESFNHPGLMLTPRFPMTQELEKARQGQNQSDHNQGAKLIPSMIVAHLPTPLLNQLSDNVRAYWDEVSVKMRDYPADMAELRSLIELGSHEILLTELRPSYPDPDALAYGQLHSALYGLGGNWLLLRNPELDKLIEETQALTDAQARQAKFHELSTFVEENALMVLMGSSRPTLLLSDKLAGCTLSAWDYDASLPAQDFTQLGLTAADGAEAHTAAQE